MLYFLFLVTFVTSLFAEVDGESSFLFCFFFFILCDFFFFLAFTVPVLTCSCCLIFVRYCFYEIYFPFADSFLVLFYISFSLSSHLSLQCQDLHKCCELWNGSVDNRHLPLREVMPPQAGGGEEGLVLNVVYLQ